MKRLLPVALSAALLVFMVTLMFRPVPQSMIDRPVKTSTTSTTTTTVGNVKTNWGAVRAGGLHDGGMGMCTNVMVDIQVADTNALDGVNRFVQLKGASGNLYAVTPVVLKAGTNPVILSLCSRQDTEWRQKVVAPWAEHDYTIKSYPRCVHNITDVTLENDNLILTSFCPVAKS